VQLESAGTLFVLAHFPKCFGVVRAIAALLQQHPKIKVHITGYASGPATRDDLLKVKGLTNQDGEIEEAASFMELSRWRAEMMHSKLVMAGVDANQISFSGGGTDGKGGRVELVCAGITRQKGEPMEGCACGCHCPDKHQCCICKEVIAPPTLFSDEDAPLYAVRGGKVFLKKSILFEPMSAMLDVSAKPDVATIAALFCRFPRATINVTNYANAPSIPNDKVLNGEIFDFNGVAVPSATMCDLSGFRADALVDLLVASGVQPSRFGAVTGHGTDGNGARFELGVEGSIEPNRVVGDRIPACTCKCHTEPPLAEAANAEEPSEEPAA